MIDYNKTFKETGYNKEYFIKYPKSGKKVYIICDECGKVRYVKLIHYHPLCRSCSKSGKLHPNYGMIISDEQKEKMSKSHTGDKNHMWQGGISGNRDHVLHHSQCIKLNKKFKCSDAHHITRSIIVYIPHELHRHLYHNLKNGQGMAEINMLALQFINGGL